MSKSARQATKMIVHLAITLCASQVFASGQPGLQPGARVRATLEKPQIGTVADPKVITGTLLGLTETTLTLEKSADEPPIIIPLQNLANLVGDFWARVLNFRLMASLDGLFRTSTMAASCAAL